MQRSGVLLLADVPIGQERREHLAAAGDRVLRIVQRVVVGRRLRQAREQGGLSERELTRVLREVRLRRGFDAVRVIAVVDGVEVLVEDLRL